MSGDEQPQREFDARALGVDVRDLLDGAPAAAERYDVDDGPSGPRPRSPAASGGTWFLGGDRPKSRHTDTGGNSGP